MNKLEEARQIISEVDEKIAVLFEQRMKASAMVAEYKMEHGMPIFDAKREEEVIRCGSARVKDDELRAYYVNFLEDVMKISKRYQSKIIEGMKVAYSGTEGAYAHIAVCRLFPSAKKVAYSDFACAYEAVVNGKCDAVVLPLENSFNGEVGQVTDLLFSGNLYINGTFDLAVSHDLLGVKGATKKDIKEVVSHPQALGQCADFIRKNGFITHEYQNTATAARFVSEKGDKTLGAIASEEAAEIFGLEVIERNINASRSNTTRFAILSRSEKKSVSNGMGISSVLLFTVKNEAGSLAKAIEIIGRYGFNMRALRSRPMKELLWQYYFFVELDGSVYTDEGKAMIAELGECCDHLKIAGTFTKEVI